MTYIIALPCVDVLDKACIEECPVDCIYEGERMLYIHPDECVDCGACEPVCPVEAIFYEDDVPDQWKDYYKANVEFFSELGSPGGASKTGKINVDHPHRGRAPAAGGRALRSLAGAAAARSPGTRSPGRGSAPAPPGRDRGPVGRHAGRPGARCHPGGAGRGADSPGYPATYGTPALREAAAGWLARAARRHRHARTRCCR